jgi:hypothetical protein
MCCCRKKQHKCYRIHDVAVEAQGRHVRGDACIGRQVGRCVRSPHRGCTRPIQVSALACSPTHRQVAAQQLVDAPTVCQRVCAATRALQVWCLQARAPPGAAAVALNPIYKPSAPTSALRRPCGHAPPLHLRPDHLAELRRQHHHSRAPAPPAAQPQPSLTSHSNERRASCLVATHIPR